MRIFLMATASMTQVTLNITLNITVNIAVSIAVNIAVVMLVSPASVNAQESSSYVWYDGSIRHEVHLKNNLAAEFGFKNKSDSSTSMQKLSGKVIKVKGGTRIIRLTSEGQQKVTTSGLGPNQSPVFSDSPTGGALRALPGGILVTFSEAKSHEAIRAWGIKNKLELAQVLPTSTATIALFKTQPGLVSLNEANRIRELPGITAAQPNWWTEKWSGPAATNRFTPAQVDRAQSQRRLSSEQFSAPLNEH